MSGIVNSTGSRSGIIGTTVGTPAAGTLVKTAFVVLSSDFTLSNSTTQTTFLTGVYSPDGGTGNDTTIYAYLYMVGMINGTTLERRAKFRVDITGSDITDKIERPKSAAGGNYGISTYGHAATDVYSSFQTMVTLGAVTLDGTGNADITYECMVKHSSASGYQDLYGDNTEGETHIQFWEVQQ